ncbi:hypothetical protein IU422_07710 [Nocardia farcinica]|nr:hypothetical protein [Nocardia farcinica]
MTDELSRLALHVVVPEPERPGRNVELRALVDGVDVVAAAFHSGPARSPQELLRPGGPLEATAEPHEVRLAEAECTEGCCGALHVMVRGDDEHVVWSEWRNTGRGEHPAGRVPVRRPAVPG